MASASFEPRSALTDKQKETLAEFRKKLVELTPEEELFCDDMCLIRYLRARDYDLTKSFALLSSTLKWRSEFGVSKLDPDTLYEEIQTGKIYHHGKDLLGRPILYLRSYRENTKNYRKHLELLVHNFESCFAEMDKSRGIEQLCVILDFTGFTLWNSPPISSTVATIDILLNHCPERLGVAFFVNTPSAFSVLWKISKPLLNEKTLSKVHFISGPIGPGTKKHDLFSKYFDLNQLEPEFGGTMKWNYTPNEFWAAECKISKQRKEEFEQKVREIEERRKISASD